MKEIEFPWPVATIVSQHHKRISGCGYSVGLSGDDIIIEAKTLAVADVVEAMASQISAKRNKFFRWHDSGDVQDVEHLSKIFAVCRMTPDTAHWMPTREAWVKKYLNLAPGNLVIRFSATMVDQDAPASWPNTSTVVTKSAAATCPAPSQGNACKDCRACWDKSIKNVAYAAH